MYLLDCVYTFTKYMMKEITDEDEVKINNTKWCISIYA